MKALVLTLGLAGMIGALVTSACAAERKTYTRNVAIVVYEYAATGLPIGSMLDAVTSTRSAPWALAAISGVSLLAIGFGVTHIVRRQSKPLPIPYGLAISAAGLWLLASKYLTIAPGAANLG